MVHRKDMMGNRGEGNSHNKKKMWKGKEMIATGDNVEMDQKEGFGKKWRAMVPGGGKRVFWGKRVNTSKKKKSWTKIKSIEPYLGRLTSGAPDLEREKTEKRNRKRKKKGHKRHGKKKKSIVTTLDCSLWQTSWGRTDVRVQIKGRERKVNKIESERTRSNRKHFLSEVCGGVWEV